MIFRNDKGAAAVEFAIVLPILLVLVFGIIEFSVLFYDKAMLTNASREGARAGIVWRPADPQRLTEADIQAVVQNYLQNYLINLGGDSNATITAPAAGSPRGTLLTVDVSYQYDFLVLPGFIADLADIQLQARTVMRME